MCFLYCSCSFGVIFLNRGSKCMLIIKVEYFVILHTCFSLLIMGSAMTTMKSACIELMEKYLSTWNHTNNIYNYTLCPILRLEVMLLSVDWVLTVSNHKTHILQRFYILHTRFITWNMQSTSSNKVSNLKVGQSVYNVIVRLNTMRLSQSHTTHTL